MFCTFFVIAFIAFISLSQNTAFLAPLLSASIPSAPLPANKSKTFLVAVVSTVITLLIALGLPLPANSETIATSVLTLLTLGGVLNDSTTQSLFNDIDAEELKASKLARATEKSEMRCSKYIRKQNEKLAKKAMKKR